MKAHPAQSGLTGPPNGSRGLRCAPGTTGDTRPPPPNRPISDRVSCYLAVSVLLSSCFRALLFRRFYRRFNNLAVPARDNPLVTGKPALAEASFQPAPISGR